MAVMQAMYGCRPPLRYLRDEGNDGGGCWSLPAPSMLMLWTSQTSRDRIAGVVHLVQDTAAKAPPPLSRACWSWGQTRTIASHSPAMSMVDYRSKAVDSWD